MNEPSQKEGNNEPEHYEVELDQIEAQREANKVPMNGHSWKQRGTEVYCSSCPFSHSFYVAPGTFMTGIDENGAPIFVVEY